MLKIGNGLTSRYGRRYEGRAKSLHSPATEYENWYLELQKSDDKSRVTARIRMKSFYSTYQIVTHQAIQRLKWRPKLGIDLEDKADLLNCRNLKDKVTFRPPLGRSTTARSDIVAQATPRDVLFPSLDERTAVALVEPLTIITEKSDTSQRTCKYEFLLPI